MVARTLLQCRRQLAIFERVVGGRQEVAEELARAERRRSDLHEPQPGRVRQRAGAAQEQHLAAGGRAFTREASARQVDVRRETLHAGERDEMPCDGALAEEHDGRRSGKADAFELRPHGCVDRGIGLRSTDRDAEPHRPHRARRRRDPVDRLRDAPVLRDLRPGEHADQHRRPDRDPDSGEERSGRAAAHSAEGETDDVEGRPHAVAFRRR